MRRRLAAVLVVLLLAAPVARADEVPYRHYTTADGLPHEYVHALAQSADRRLYVGTSHGLSVYDGEQFRTVPFPDSLDVSTVDELLVRPDSTVWVTAGTGYLAQVRGQHVVRVVPVSGGISSLLVHRDTLYAFTSQSGYWTLAPDAVRPEHHPYRYGISLWEGPGDETRGRGVYDAVVAPENRIWILDGRRGPGRFGPDGTVEFEDVPRVQSQRWWRRMWFVAPGEALLFGRQSVYGLDTRTGRLQMLARDVGYTTTYRRDDHTVFVSGTARRRVPGNTRLPSLDRLGVPANQVRCALVDHEGSLWVGTRGGLFQLYAPGVRHVRQIDGKALSNVGNLSVDHAGALWAVSWGSGLLRLRPRPASFRPGGENLWVSATSQTGRVHAMSAAGWYRYEHSTGWQRLGPSAGAVRGVVGPSGHGYFWTDAGLARYTPHSSVLPDTLFRWPPSQRSFNMMGPDQRGGFVLRSRDRLYAAPLGAEAGPRDSLLRQVARLPGYETARGRYLAADGRGVVWLAFWKRGLVRVDTRLAAPRLDSFLVGRPLQRVALAGDSLVFATAKDGLYVLDAAGGRLQRHLTLADGLLGNTTKDALIDGDTLYVSHTLGLTKMPLDVLFDGPPPPEALLTRVERSFESVSPEAAARFEAGDRTVGFSFAATAFRNPERVRYQYRLMPRDTSWTSTAENVTRYTELPPGRYRFEVRARRAGGPAGPSVAYAFAIPRFFYETRWFRLLALLALSLAAAGAYRWRVRTLRRRQRLLERRVESRTEELRREKRLTEEQAERLAELDRAKNRFFANVSHEFRTPLTLILGPLRDMLDGAFGALPEAADEQLGLMQRNARRLQRLIDRLLDLTKLEAGRMKLRRQRADLAAFTERLVQRFTPMAEHHEVALQVRAQDAPLPASFDPDKMEQVIANLLSNALKFTPAGGKVWVVVRACADEDAAVPTAEIVVKDTGPGLSRDELRRIFDRFEQVGDTATREHEGTGLGLALARELVELHGGSIYVESEPGFGTAFTVRLPLEESIREPESRDDGERESGSAEEREPAAVVPRMEERGAVTAGASVGLEPSMQAGDPPSATRHPPSKILVVEDNEDVRAYLRRHLEGDYAVVEARDGEEGLEAAREHEPDLVLSDVMMPKQDGYALCAAIKADEALAATPVVLLTAKADASDAVEGLECGADDYVAKPFEMSELRARIDRLIASRRRLHERFSHEVHVEPVGTFAPEEEVPLLERVAAVVEEHLDEPAFTVDDLAGQMALGRRQLTRRLKEAAGETPATLIRRVRLEHAARLLAEDEHTTVAEVAYAVGYNSPSHFAKAFRKHFGCAPSEYEGPGE